MALNQRTGGQILVDQLCLHGADTAFCVPGESYLAVLDGLHDRPEINLVTCRQEGGAAMMAEAHGKLTGRPGICLVTRGPGATNASAGVHVAFQDSTPMILLIGDVASDQRHREAFQEVDFVAMFTPLAKWAARIDDAARIPEYMARAFTQATSGRPGPVVLALPEDMLTSVAEVADARPFAPVPARPAAEDMARVATILAGAEKPLVIAGGPGWSEACARGLAAFCEANGLPVAASLRCQDYVDNASPAFIGHAGIATDPAVAGAMREADCLLVIGSRMGEMTSGGYTLVDIPTPQQKLIHICPDAGELSRVYQPDIGLISAAEPFISALSDLKIPENATRKARMTELRAQYEGFTAPVEAKGAFQMAEIVKWLRETLPRDAIITNGAGNYASWLHRFYSWRSYRSQLAPTSGSMGYGLPAAVAAKLAHPDRAVVCFAGDGCFMMTGQELATAVQYELSIIIIVVNNGSYGTIRMHQEKHYPARISGTDLVNPDFAALARSYGAHGETVERTEDFAVAFGQAQGSGKPAVIEVRQDLDAITPSMSLSEMRNKALATQKAG